jgi:hypothetical protein
MTKWANTLLDPAKTPLVLEKTGLNRTKNYQTRLKNHQIS